MHRKCRERFPCHPGLAIPTCITARASRACLDACRDRWLTVSFRSWWRGKRSRHSRRMRNPQFYLLCSFFSNVIKFNFFGHTKQCVEIARNHLKYLTDQVYNYSTLLTLFPTIQIILSIRNYAKNGNTVELDFDINTSIRIPHGKITKALERYLEMTAHLIWWYGQYHVSWYKTFVHWIFSIAGALGNSDVRICHRSHEYRCYNWHDKLQSIYLCNVY